MKATSIAILVILAMETIAVYGAVLIQKDPERIFLLAMLIPVQAFISFVSGLAIAYFWTKKVTA